MCTPYALPSANRMTGIDPSTMFVCTPVKPMMPSGITTPSRVDSSESPVPSRSRNDSSTMIEIARHAHGASARRSLWVTS